MKVSIIAAVAENGAIGKDNDLIWNLPDDMMFFRDTTRGKPVIMGRKNYESIPEKYRPLPGRQNIILTRNKNFEAPDCDVVHSPEEALEVCKNRDEVFVIGGEEVYRLFLKKSLVDKMYLTRINETFDADAFFPDFNRNEWKGKILSEHPADHNHAFSFFIEELERIIG